MVCVTIRPYPEEAEVELSGKESVPRFFLGTFCRTYVSKLEPRVNTTLSETTFSSAYRFLLPVRNRHLPSALTFSGMYSRSRNAGTTNHAV